MNSLDLLLKAKIQPSCSVTPDAAVPHQLPQDLIIITKNSGYLAASKDLRMVEEDKLLELRSVFTLIEKRSLSEIETETSGGTDRICKKFLFNHTGR